MIRRLFPAIKTVLHKSDNMSPFQRVKLDKDQQLILSYINGKNTIADICSLSGLGDFNALKALYVLYAYQLIE